VIGEVLYAEKPNENDGPTRQLVVHKDLLLLSFYHPFRPFTPRHPLNHIVRLKWAGVCAGFELEGGMFDFEARRKVFADVGHGGGARDDGQT
jgi:hypothetical protein